MKLSLCIFFLIFLVPFAYPQGEANIWYFGQNAGIDFNSGFPMPLLNGALNTNEGCASISDVSGNILFYTDGVTVYNKLHQIMQNGTNLAGNFSSTHSAIIVPKPNNPNLYFIFTVDIYNEGDTDGLQYSEIDMSLDNGLGGVTIKNVPLEPIVNEKVIAVKNYNNSGYWVVSHKHNSNEFIAFEVTSTGVNSIPVISSIGSNTGYFNVTGQIKISPNGNRLVVARGGEVQLFDFDNNTGIISNPITLDNGIINSYGVEFSTDGNVLYVSFVGGVYQYNLLAGSISDIISSKINLININESFTSMQLAPNGKIYIARNEKLYLDFIDSPNIIGLGCNYIHNGFYLNGAESRLGLPTFVQSFFSTNIYAQNFCLGDGTEFSLTNTDGVISVSWDFGDGNYGNALTETHTYLTTGTFIVNANITTSSGTTSQSKEVIISNIPTATQPSNIEECDDDNDGFYSFNLTQNTTTILNGQATSQYSVRYFSGSTVITDPTDYENQTAFTTETITAEVYNVDNGNCKAITTFEIQVFESPTPTTTILPIEKCDNTSFGTDTDGRVVFDLTQRVNDILNGQSASTFTVEYYTDSALTNLITTPTSYVNTTSTETIYVKVYNTQNPSCEATTSFQIEVFSLPVVNSPVVLKQCDDDNDGYSAFNLTEAIGLISNDTSLNFTFHETAALANSGTNPITNLTAYTNQTVSNDTIYVRVENFNGCYRVVTLNLVVSTTLISTTIQEHFYACDDTVSGSNTDGIATFDFSNVTAIISAQYPAGQLLTITYYRNLADALAEQNEITDISNYTNIGYPATQNIYVRVDSQLNNECLGLGHHITLHVEAIPIVQPQQYTHCDDDQDGQFSFDTTNLESDLLNGLTNVTVSYFDASGNPVSMTNPFNTASQILTARVINNTTTACFYETTITFTVDDLPEAFSIPNNLIKVCDDEAIPSLQDGSFAFDTSNFQTLILGSQTGMNVNYYDENGNLLPSPLPNPFITNTQNILVEVINPSNTNCTATTNIPFEVYPIPIIELNGNELICSNDSSFTKVLNAGLENENEQFNYSYTWFLNEAEIVGENNYELTVNTEGIYTVEVENSNSCVVTRTIQVNASNNAVIENIEISELTNNNSIIITVSGSGDYEYSLNGIDYQDSNSFYNVNSGIYTVYIRDKNGCGSTTEEVAVLGIPNYFTPNGDGYNDTWNIKGANTNFNANTIIYIFDRYGKLLKQISPLGNGWDGTYNGQLMSSSDYWYSIELENGKIVKGHFSLKR